MDRALKLELAELLAGFPAAVLVATHDPEFVAAFAERVVLLADGVAIADGPAREVFAEGSYFATETARILGGAGGALTPADGAALISQRSVEREVIVSRTTHASDLQASQPDDAGAARSGEAGCRAGGEPAGERRRSA
jgi:energy-coupling factor transport system ATP-binding protein